MYIRYSLGRIFGYSLFINIEAQQFNKMSEFYDEIFGKKQNNRR